MNHGRWDSVLARVYYFLGLSYYLYKWLFASALGGFLSAAITFKAEPLFSIILFIASLFALGAGAAFGYRAFRERYQSMNPGLKMRNVEICYAELGSGKFRTTRKIEAQVVRHGTDHYIQKFLWSGLGSFTPAVRNSNYKIEVTKEPDGPYSVCRVTFDRPKSRGDIVTIEYSIEMTDNAGTARCFLSSRINEKVHNILTMRLSFPHSDKKTTQINEVFLSSASDIPIFDSCIPVQPGSHEVEWKIKKPRLNYRYRLRLE